MKPQSQQKFAIRKQMVVMLNSEKSKPAGRTGGSGSITAATVGGGF